MNRTHRTLGLLALGAGAVAIVPQVAHGHTATAACENNRIVAQGSLFPVSPPVTSAELTVDGVARPTLPVSPIAGPNPRVVFPELIYGQHVVIVGLRNGGLWQSGPTSVDCGPPPAPPFPPPSDEPGPPPRNVTPEPPVVTPSCPTYRKLYPKAGPKFWERIGCAPPRKVVKPPKVKPPRKVTCRFLISVGAGPKEYAKRGWYYRCKAPVQPPGPYLPPVAG